MIFFAFMTVTLFFALVMQHLIPALPWLHEARVLLLPVVFFYGALAAPGWTMLGLAFVTGFMWDALNVQVMDSTVEISLGWSIILYAALGAIMNGFRPLYQRGHGWEIHCLMCGPLVALLTLAEFLMITFRRGDFLFPPVVWWRIGGAGVVAMVIAPLLYFTLQAVVTTLGWSVSRRRKVDE